jgi:hypothetical protein
MTKLLLGAALEVALWCAFAAFACALALAVFG